MPAIVKRGRSGSTLSNHSPSPSPSSRQSTTIHPRPSSRRILRDRRRSATPAAGLRAVYHNQNSRFKPPRRRFWCPLCHVLRHPKLGILGIHPPISRPPCGSPCLDPPPAPRANRAVTSPTSPIPQTWRTWHTSPPAAPAPVPVGVAGPGPRLPVRPSSLLPLARAPQIRERQPDACRRHHQD
jgi:hypothetical protein